MSVRRRSWSGRSWSGWSLAVAVALAGAVRVRPAAAAFTPDPKLAADTQRGRRLTDDAAKGLEGFLALHPDDPATHAQLVGYYYDRAAAFPQQRLAHLLWEVRHRPADPLTPAYGMVSPLADAPAYTAAATAWDEQVTAHPADTAVLANAAVFLDNGTDTARAQDLLRKAMDLEPKSSAWPSRLATSLERDADRHPDQAADLCGQALALRQAAYKLTQDRADRFHGQIHMPADAYQTGDLITAKRLASTLLEAADDFPNDPARPEAVHRGNIVLGEVALHSGNTDRAETFLATAGRVPTSPALATAGPDLGLAKELLAKGERTAVRDYLVECEAFWTTGRERLKAWVALMDTGGTPDLGP